MKTTNWFKKVGWFYLPVSLPGFIFCIAAILFLVPIFQSIIRNGHSMSDDLYHFFIYITATAFWLKWIAENSSSNN